MSNKLIKSFKIYINSDTVKKNDKILLISVFFVVTKRENKDLMRLKKHSKYKTENPCVSGSIPLQATKKSYYIT